MKRNRHPAAIIVSRGSPLLTVLPFFPLHPNMNLKGLGNAILGNFTTDQIIIELIKITKITSQNYRRTLTKHRKAKRGHGWIKLERIVMDCISVDLKNFGPPFFIFTVCRFTHVSKCHLHPGEGGGYLTKFNTGRLRPLPFYIPFWQKRNPFSIPFIAKRYPFTYLPVTPSYE